MHGQNQKVSTMKAWDPYHQSGVESVSITIKMVFAATSKFLSFQMSSIFMNFLYCFSMLKHVYAFCKTSRVNIIYENSIISRLIHFHSVLRKLIGARYFNKGYRAYLETSNATISPALNATFFSARDHDGHGSHTLSTAGGSFAPSASYLGNGNGTAKGGSPKARVAIYKVCWPPIDGNECFDADILAGFDAAISDGVDVISISLGGVAGEFFEDGISIGSFHAVKNNIVAVASAGNDGPGSGTVSNVSPWIVTVGATTLDRGFTSYVSLGNKIHIEVKLYS